MGRNILLLLALYSGFCVRAQNIDVKILQQIHAPHYTETDKTFKFLTNSTTTVSLGIPATLMAIGWLRDDSAARRNAVVIAVSYAIVGAATLSLKYFSDRPRPFETYPQFFMKKASGGSPSFPSGHTSLAFTAATSLSLAYPKWYVVVPSYLWAGSVAYSRMHLGVHYPSDVLVGAAIGTVSAYLSYKANQWLHKKYHY